MAENIAERQGVMTLAEYVRRYQTEGPFEILDGVIVPTSPVMAGHGDKARRTVWRWCGSSTRSASASPSISRAASTVWARRTR